ncbi:glycosyltransferase family 2 protein [Hymenobacter sp. GOD-10R]|uniref:glycosyltransferase family 2 protein n=1 Tax=Hymenobacter sp. GOD-10R TaxID=3093922 RepID=UPI002D78ACC1|nr:glycosyltransferase family 2 protein [Hymenobacter sp. GOD-10R]WRQ27465.1 glycosyltransferase family 2 protein [Hymenobacter sp. GOD-10R]
MPKLSIIIPCYFNEANIPVTTRELIANESLFPSEVSFEYVLVDDGSRDNTLRELLAFRAAYPNKVRVVELAGNVGSYNAIVAGMEYATGDCLAIITADLQDPPELMVQMYDYWRKGLKLVIGNRQDREETGLQKLFSNAFHALMKRIALPNIPDGGFDFVFFDRKVSEEILKLKERNSNIFYLMVWLGYPYVNIPYVRRKRKLGKSRWTLQKKIKLLIDSVMAFSFFPVRAISVLGILLGFSALFYGIYLAVLRVLGDIQVEGWTGLMVVMLFVAAFQMIALGIIGEYVWRGLDAARRRPLYVVQQVYEQNQEK